MLRCSRLEVLVDIIKVIAEERDKKNKSHVQSKPSMESA